jgi:hypothetical protein
MTHGVVTYLQISRFRWLALGLSLACASAAHAQTKAFCCMDAKGSRTCGDILPSTCYDRAYVEIHGGRVVREVEAPLTPEQKLRKDAELRAQRDRQAKETEARRRDQVLLESYSTIGELDRRRDRDLGNIDGELSAARAREASLIAQLAELGKRKPPSGRYPKQLADAIAADTSELEAVRSVIASKQREIEQMRDRFDADHARYLQLTDQAAQSFTSPSR